MGDRREGVSRDSLRRPLQWLAESFLTGPGHSARDPAAILRLQRLLGLCNGSGAQLEMGAIRVRFSVRAVRLLLTAVVLKSWNFASSSALRKEDPRAAKRW